MNEPQFLDDLRELLAQQPFRRADIAMYPATDKEDAARWCAENARMSTKTDLWMVYLVSESTPEGEIDGTRYVEHAVTSAITGNGPRSEYYARLYMLLHNAAPNIVRALEERDALRRVATAARGYTRAPDDATWGELRAALRALEPPTNDTP